MGVGVAARIGASKMGLFEKRSDSVVWDLASDPKPAALEDNPGTCEIVGLLIYLARIQPFGEPEIYRLKFSIAPSSGPRSMGTPMSSMAAP
jgi:hypothetical protein